VALGIAPAPDGRSDPISANTTTTSNRRRPSRPRPRSSTYAAAAAPSRSDDAGNRYGGDGLQGSARRMRAPRSRCAGALVDLAPGVRDLSLSPSLSREHSSWANSTDLTCGRRGTATALLISFDIRPLLRIHLLLLLLLGFRLAQLSSPRASNWIDGCEEPVQSKGDFPFDRLRLNTALSIAGGLAPSLSSNGTPRFRGRVPRLPRTEPHLGSLPPSAEAADRGQGPHLRPIPAEAAPLDAGAI
jgi:hypothetical protein